ncbi:MAG: c-type cytochrome [Acidiferrobacteraceae bacterium]
MNKMWAVVVGVTWLGVVPGAHAADRAPGQRKAAECEGCHGPNGDSAISSYPKLAGQGASYLERQIRDFKNGKRQDPVMSGVAAGLSPIDIRNISTFFAHQTMSPSGAHGNAETIALGRKVYRRGDRQRGVPACMSCHGPMGAGAPPYFPRIGGQWAQYIRQQLLAFRNGTRRNDPSEMMRSIAAHMTRPEIAAVSQYVGGLGARPAHP